MASTDIQPSRNHHPFTAKPKLLKVCFSYAAYAKNLIRHLSASNIPVEQGLSDEEFSSVESVLKFTFPPDLRSILQEGLPVGPGFPNWRSSSMQQLDILMSLPVIGICKEVSRNGFWMDSWGERPADVDRAVKMANGFLIKAPVLVPVYRHFYIPATPCMSGNPVFHVHGGDVKLRSFDVGGFFQQAEFGMTAAGVGDFLRQPSLASLFAAPAWAAKEARRIEFWSEMAEGGVNTAVARVDTRGWWSGDLGGCLDEVYGRLREGGWMEKDVRQMMMMDGCDEVDRGDSSGDEPLDREFVEGWVRVLSERLLRAGWSTEDVVESLGFSEDFLFGEEFCFDFHDLSQMF